MSEITRCVIGMPFDLAMGGELSRRQFHSIAQALLAENDRLTEEYDKAWRHDLNDKNNVQVLTAEVVRLNAEIERLRTAEGDAMTYKAGVENVAQQRDQLKAEVERLKHENRLLTEHNEFLASSDSRLAPELRTVKDALGLDFTASVTGEVVPLIERLRKLPTCWTEVLEQSEANDQLLDQVLGLSADADRYRFLCDKFGVTDLPCALERILDGDLYVADGKPSIDSVIDAARSKEAK